MLKRDDFEERTLEDMDQYSAFVADLEMLSYFLHS